MTPEGARELDRLRVYATEVASHCDGSEENRGVVVGGIGYLGGALSVLHSLGHISSDEIECHGEKLLAVLSGD